MLHYALRLTDKISIVFDIIQTLTVRNLCSWMKWRSRHQNTSDAKSVPFNFLRFKRKKYALVNLRFNLLGVVYSSWLFMHEIVPSAGKPLASFQNIIHVDFSLRLFTQCFWNESKRRERFFYLTTKLVFTEAFHATVLS